MSCGAGNRACSRLDYKVFPKLTELEDRVKELEAMMEPRQAQACEHGVIGVRCDNCYGSGLLAQGIETRSATDAQRRGPKGESPVAKPGAPNPRRRGQVMDEQMIEEIAKAIEQSYLDNPYAPHLYERQATAAHSVMAGKVAELEGALKAAQIALRHSMPVFPDVERQVAAALAPHPKGME